MSEILYAACETTCKFEYGPAIVSIHKTKEGAEKALEGLVEKEKARFDDLLEYIRESNPEYDKEYWNWESFSGREGDFIWCIQEIELQD